ncbi:hypothetical protein AC25_5218 [Escherichia coli 1-110-08_S3_C2]|nr:hypothetical protein AC25_5218 [Escherichia coli 1-110-08_S3_C2]EYE15627.1 hypothetical protein AC55_0053 [Escherichia coli 1-110-08_S3_C3]
MADYAEINNFTPELSSGGDKIFIYVTIRNIQNILAVFF